MGTLCGSCTCAAGGSRHHVAWLVSQAMAHAKRMRASQALPAARGALGVASNLHLALQVGHLCGVGLPEALVKGGLLAHPACRATATNQWHYWNDLNLYRPVGTECRLAPVAASCGLRPIRMVLAFCRAQGGWRHRLTEASAS